MHTHAMHRRLASPAAVVLAGVVVLALGGGCQQQFAASRPQQLTIVLVEFEGANAVAAAERSAQKLSSMGIPDVFVVPGASRASVCAGHYDSLHDPRARETLGRVHQIQDSKGQYPFAGVLLMPVPEQAPENPWPLEQAKGYFSLQVALWEAPGRMAAAQAYAAQLRSQGYEAYAYHGPVYSSVTIGAFGPEIFDAPEQFARPGARPPKIIDPKVLDLMKKKFKYMRMEGQDTPPEANVQTFLVEVPGRKPPVGRGVRVPRVAYRIATSLVDTRTGLASGRGRASGGAPTKDEIPVLVKTLVKQMLAAIPPGKVARVGVVGALATDTDAAKERADAAVSDALVAALGSVGAGKIELSDVAATRQILDAAGKKPMDILRDPRGVKGLAALDFVAVGTVTSFSAENAGSSSSGPQP